MTIETFFTNFGHLADAPNGVQKLRELILQLAVQGKLVPQDPSDEPASVLLERIRKERAGKVSRRGEKFFAPTNPINIDKIPYELPQGWEWVRLVDLVTLEYGKNLPAPKRNQSGGVPVYGSNGVVGKHDEALLERPSIIVGRKGSSGALNISRTPCWPTDVTYFVVPPETMDFEYCYLLLKSLNLDELGKGIKPGLNRNEAYPLPVVLPPLEEQKRIVAKVDQLMALCDELEARQQKEQQKRVRLNNSALDALLTAREPNEFADHWQRISTNFYLLYDHPDTIAKLRAAILQLAVQGKLVSQDPNDEPAAVLLERVKAERGRLVKEGKIKKENKLPDIDEGAEPHDFPEGWSIIPLGKLIELVSGQHLKPAEYNDRSKGIPYLTGPADFGSIHPLAARWTTVRRAVALRNDILITVKGSGVGKTNVLLDGEAAISRQLMAIRPILVDSEFVLNVLKTAYEEFQGMRVGIAIPGIGREDVLNYILGLPPLEEQKRIVAKVDQLMVLCDELEAKLNQAQQHSEKLMEATVRQFLVA